MAVQGQTRIEYYADIDDLHAVPVRPRPRIKTFMGTVRVHFLRSMSVSFVKISVMGLDLYLQEYAILPVVIVKQRCSRRLQVYWSIDLFAVSIEDVAEKINLRLCAK